MNQPNPSQNKVYRSVQPRRATQIENRGVKQNKPQVPNIASTVSQPRVTGRRQRPERLGQAETIVPTTRHSNMPQPNQSARSVPFQKGNVGQEFEPNYAPSPQVEQTIRISMHDQQWADPTHVNATLGQRIGAYIIDALILGMVQALILLFMGGLSQSGNEDAAIGGFMIGILVLVLVSYSYKMVLEATTGQTLGKKFLGLRLVTTDGRRMGWGHALKRNFNLLYNLIPFLGGPICMGSYVARCFSVMNSPYSQGYHDRWANTRLIKET